MAPSNLYFRGCFEHLSDDQKSAIEGITDENIVDKSCSRGDVNTCGMSVEKLFETYSIFNPQKGIYKSWGDIEFPWEIIELTPNLLFSQTDNRWNVATYRQIVAYPLNSRILYIEDDGYRVSLYQANQDVLALNGAFNPSQWDKICHVDTTIPVGLPSVQELLERFELYQLKLFNTEWGEYNSSWKTPSKEITLTDCASRGLSFADFEKCVKDGSSDEWKNAQIHRDFFYKRGDVFVAYGPCEDVLCLYIVTQDFLASEENLIKYNSFDSRAPYWQKLYCVSTGKNKCLEYQRRKKPELGYDVVQIGSKGHFVEMPIPYRLKPQTQDLIDRSQGSISLPPTILTQEQINAISQPLEE